MGLRKESFTLVEVITIILILGILAAVSIPRVDMFNVIKLSGAGRKLFSDLRYAQNLAVSRHANTCIQFYTTDRKYSGFICSAAACFPMAAHAGNWVDLQDPFSRDNLGVNFTNDQQYRGIRIGAVDFAGTDIAAFNWLGEPVDTNGSAVASNGTVSLTYQGSSATATVAPKTGRVAYSKSF